MNNVPVPSSCFGDASVGADGHKEYATFDLLRGIEDEAIPAVKPGGAVQFAASSGAVLTASISNMQQRTGALTASAQAGPRRSASQGLEDMADGLEGPDEAGSAADGAGAATGSPEHLDADEVRLRHNLLLTWMACWNPLETCYYIAA